jgi:SP family sugar:H+ symporter-like MFS transporter
MGVFNKTSAANPAAEAPIVQEKSVTGTSTPVDRSEANASSTQAVQGSNIIVDNAVEQRRVTPIAVLLGAIASIGGFMFGYESGQISGRESRFCGPQK